MKLRFAHALRWVSTKANSFAAWARKKADVYDPPEGTFNYILRLNGTPVYESNNGKEASKIFTDYILPKESIFESVSFGKVANIRKS